MSPLFRNHAVSPVRWALAGLSVSAVMGASGYALAKSRRDPPVGTTKSAQPATTPCDPLSSTRYEFSSRNDPTFKVMLTEEEIRSAHDQLQTKLSGDQKVRLNLDDYFSGGRGSALGKMGVQNRVEKQLKAQHCSKPRFECTDGQIADIMADVLRAGASRTCAATLAAPVSAPATAPAPRAVPSDDPAPQAAPAPAEPAPEISQPVVKPAVAAPSDDEPEAHEVHRASSDVISAPAAATGWPWWLSGCVFLGCSAAAAWAGHRYGTTLSAWYQAGVGIVNRWKQTPSAPTAAVAQASVAEKKEAPAQPADAAVVDVESHFEPTLVNLAAAGSAPTNVEEPVAEEKKNPTRVEGTAAPVEASAPVAPAPSVGSWVGQVVTCPYTIDRKLGKGGMGSVYHAVAKNGAEVAVKIPFLYNDQFLPRFQREVLLLKKINHPNVVQYISDGTLVDGTPYLVCEFIHGNSLGEVLEKKWEKAIMPWDLVGLIAWQTLRGLAAMHAQDLLHRDIKPDNLMLTVRDGTPHITIIDLGIARSLDPDVPRHTAVGVAVGSPRQMAPELIRQQEATERTDIYAVGATMYWMLAGHTLYHELTNLLAIYHAILSVPVPELPPSDCPFTQALSAVVMKALAKNPDERFQSVAEMLAALDAVLEVDEQPTSLASSASARLAATQILELSATRTMRSDELPTGVHAMNFPPAADDDEEDAGNPTRELVRPAISFDTSSARKRSAP